MACEGCDSPSCGAWDRKRREEVERRLAKVKEAERDLVDARVTLQNAAAAFDLVGDPLRAKLTRLADMLAREALEQVTRR
jgi:hypothetical protein